MKTLKKIVNSFLFLLLSSVIISGCATNRIYLNDQDKIMIEKVASRSAYISKLSAYSINSDTTIFGAVHKRLPGRGHIFGHVDIEVFSPDETVLFTTTSGYHRWSLKSFLSVFTVKIPFELEEGSTIRVTHHRAFRTENEKKEAGIKT